MAYDQQTWQNGKYLEGLLPIKLHDPFIRGLARSRDKVDPIYRHYHRAYGHQTWQGGYIM